MYIIINIQCRYQNIIETSGSQSDAELDTRVIGTTGSYALRKRKPKDCGWSLRGSMSKVSYTEFFGNLDLPPTLKWPKQVSLSVGPTPQHLSARGKKSEPPKVTHLSTVKRMLKVETTTQPSTPDTNVNSSDNNQEVIAGRSYDNPMVTKQQSDQSDDDLPLSDLKKKLNSDESTPVKCRVLVTRWVGIKKHRRKPSYTCPVCSDRFENQGQLNRHYREKHDTVKWPLCQQMFMTLCSLIWHCYLHASPRFFCRCGQGYYFSADLCIHKLMHRCICTQICVHPGCGNSYFSASDLAQHALIHENIDWKCLHCDYVTKDKRLLKSHQCVHDQSPRYFCMKCSRGFMYHTQCKRHDEKGKCSPLKRSSSPSL